jgi:hypothetical protein
VLDRAAGEQLAQGAVTDVAPVVVGHQPPHLDPVCREEGERPRGEGGDGRGAAVGEQLGVAEPRVVVDDRVCEVVADLRLLLGRGRAPVTGDGVAGALEAGVERPVGVE